MSCTFARDESEYLIQKNVKASCRALFYNVLLRNLVYLSGMIQKKQVSCVGIQSRNPENEKFRPCLGLSWLVAGFSLRTPEFSPTSVHAEFLMNKVSLGWILLTVLPFSLVGIISQILRSH
jgi:hypothetical protein